MNNVIKIEIDLNTIKNWNDFHDIFAEKFGFPDYYGRNMNAWLDVMWDLKAPLEKSQIKVSCGENEMVVLDLLNVANCRKSNPEIFNELIDLVALTNKRWSERGLSPVLIFSYR